MVKPSQIAELQDLPISELKRRGFLYRHAKVVFGPGSRPGTPGREADRADNFDTLFENQEAFQTWQRRVTAGLAELDECMNYCQYFERIKGNDGYYVRDGKRFPVNGQWCGLHDFGSSYTADFETWLKEHGWYDNWFELHDRYKNYHLWK